MIKTFPKSRICVIDIYPSFEQGIKLGIEFASKHNISLMSADGRRIILSFCLKNIETEYKTTQSTFPKVLCMSKKSINKRLSNFIDNYFAGVMDSVPMPYCGKFDLNSPDLEAAAENSLKKKKGFQKYGNILRKLKIKSS